jgi:hypothetical protein
MANYSYEPVRAADVVEADSLRHISQQIAPDGSIPCEDARNLQFSFGYHVGDLLMMFELGYASSTTRADVDVFTHRGQYPWPAKYGTNESGSLAIALEWLAPLCAREKPWTIGKDFPSQSHSVLGGGVEGQGCRRERDLLRAGVHHVGGSDVATILR